MLLIRSLCFYLGQAASTLVFVPVCLVIFPLRFKTRYYLVTRWTLFNLWWLKFCCGLGYRVTGLEHIPAEPCIVMCKHQSVFETLVLQMIFTPQVWILKRELLKIPIYGWGLASMRPIAIDRGSARESLRQIVAQGSLRLRQRLWVIIFPEGTRVAPGAKGHYQPGGGLLAQKSGASVLPVAHNAGYLWRKNSLLKRPGAVTIAIGPAITPAGKSARQITQEAEAWIEATVKTLPDPSAE